MTWEKLNKAKILHNHINKLTDFKNELSVVTPIKVGCVTLTLNDEDIKALIKTLEERIVELEKEFKEL